MKKTTPDENEDAENFSDQLVRDTKRARDYIKQPGDLEPDEPEEPEPEPDIKPDIPKDVFDVKKGEGRGVYDRNWLANRNSDPDKVADIMKKRRMGRPKGSKNKNSREKANREAIQIMVASGVKQTVIGQLLGISSSSMQSKYKNELEHGSDILKTRISNALVQKALDGNVSAAIFYLKSKGGFREMDKDMTEENARLSDVERNQRLMALFMANPRMLEEMRQRRLEEPPVDVKIDVKDKDVFDV